ncbi:MAG TPA: GAF domain-containing protein, partial [Acidimicrobiales bacterium]|nr:GAF domain-containing protein [Acidimicrobiales bacterium]
MTTTFSELPIMQDTLSGGTTNLLRMARSGCGCAVAFVALALEDHTFATARYSSTPDEGLVGREALDEVVSLIWQDPRITRGEPVTRSVQLGGRWAGRGSSPLAVAVVPLGGRGDPWGLVGVADPGDKIFGPSDIELLGRIAKRMASYLRARHEIQNQEEGPATPSSPPPPPSAPGAEGGARSELWWKVEPGQGPGDGGPAGPGVDQEAVIARSAPEGPEPSTTWAALAAEAADELRGTFGAARRTGGAGAPTPPTFAPTPRTGQFPPAPPAFRARVVAENPAEPRRPTGPGAETRPVEPASRPERSGADFETGRGTPAPPATFESGSAGVGTTAEPDPYRDLLAEEGLPPGLIPVGALLGRTGRMLGAGSSAAGSLAVVAMEVEGAADQVGDLLVPAAV